MKKVRLTENDLVRIIERVIKESEHNEEFFFKTDDFEDMGKKPKKPKNVKHDWAINPPKDGDMSDNDIEDDFEDDFEFEDSKLAEMKRRVKVMENNLRRKKQLRRR